MMQFHSAALALAVLFTANTASAQQDQTEQGQVQPGDVQKATPLTPAKPVQPQAPEADSTTDIDALIRQLGDDDFRSRRAAEQQLRQIGEAARPGLEEALRDAQDPELRWRAHGVLRSLDMAQLRAPGPSDADAQLRRIFAPMEFDHGAPRFQGMQQQIMELQRQMDEMMRQMPGHGFPGVPPGGAPQGLFGLPPGSGMSQGLQGSQQGIKVEIGPDRVRVEIEEKDEQGESESQVYEADSIEEFRASYPEIAERYLGSPGRLFRLEAGRAPQFGQPLRVQRLQRAPGASIDMPGHGGVMELAPQGPRLGVYIAPLEPALRDYLGIDPGRGLLVASVVQDSLAAELGIEAKDIVLSVAGQPVANPSDVSRALSSVEPGAEFEVTVNRRGDQVALKASRPEAETKTGGERLKPVELR